MDFGLFSVANIVYRNTERADIPNDKVICDEQDDDDDDKDDDDDDDDVPPPTLYGTNEFRTISWCYQVAGKYKVGQFD